MELNVTRQPVTVNEIVFDSHLEQPVECDISLADYYPDIVRILKCEGTPKVLSAQASGEKITIETALVLSIYYLSEQGEIRRAEHKTQYSKSSEMRSAPRSPVVSAEATIDYLNCRATSQRRIEVRGALKLKVKILSRSQEEVISDAQSKGLHLRREMHESTALVEQTGRQFTVREELELGAGKPPAAWIIRAGGIGVVSDFKVIAGKVITKGELRLHILYQPFDEQAAPEVMEFAIPVSQIVDVDGVDEDCECEVTMQTLSCDMAPKADEEGVNTLLNAEVQLNVAVKAHRTEQVVAVNDCYSTEYECSAPAKPIAARRLAEIVNITHIHKETLDLPEEVCSILDIWSCVQETNAVCTGDSIKISGRLLICLFAADNDGARGYFERPAEFEYLLPMQEHCENISFDPAAQVLSTTYSMAGQGHADIRVELCIQGCVYFQEKRMVTANIAINQSAPKARETDCALILYFAEPGEAVWDIAKRYNTSADAVIEENGIESMMLSDGCMLLIPIVQ